MNIYKVTAENLQDFLNYAKAPGSSTVRCYAFLATLSPCAPEPPGEDDYRLLLSVVCDSKSFSHDVVYSPPRIFLVTYETPKGCRYWTVSIAFNRHGIVLQDGVWGENDIGAADETVEKM